MDKWREKVTHRLFSSISSLSATVPSSLCTDINANCTDIVMSKNGTFFLINQKKFTRKCPSLLETTGENAGGEAVAERQLISANGRKAERKLSQVQMALNYQCVPNVLN